MEYEKIIEEQLKTLDISEIERIIDENGSNYFMTDDISLKGIIDDLLTGTPLFESDRIIDNLVELFFIEVKSALVVGCEVLLVCVMIGLLTSLSNSFGNKAVSSLGTMVCSLIIITLCIGSFYQTYESCCQTMDLMTKTMGILLPVMIPLLLSMGGLSSGSIMDPVIIGAVTGFNFIMQHIVLPLIFLSAIFILINSITETDYIKKLSILLRRAGLFITGLTITIFSGITAIQGIVTKSADGILINTARFSIDNFVPIIGGFAADSLEMVISCIGLIKNAVGILGIIIILSLLVMPVLKLLAIAVIYKITAIAAEPIANKNISDSLNEIGTSAITMTVVLGSGAFMFLIFITIIMGMGGGML